MSLRAYYASVGLRSRAVPDARGAVEYVAATNARVFLFIGFSRPTHRRNCHRLRELQILEHHVAGRTTLRLQRTMQPLS
jgi:hypothetical protein